MGLFRDTKAELERNLKAEKHKSKALEAMVKGLRRDLEKERLLRETGSSCDDQGKLLSWSEVRGWSRNDVGARPFEGKEFADWCYILKERIKKLEEGNKC